MHPDFKPYYRAMIIKTVSYSHHNRHLDKIDGPELNPSICSQQYSQESQEYPCRERTVFSNDPWKIGEIDVEQRNWTHN